MIYQKHPRGVMPRFIWLRNRADELAQAISRLVMHDEKSPQLTVWVIELAEVLEALRHPILRQTDIIDEEEKE